MRNTMIGETVTSPTTQDLATIESTKSVTGQTVLVTSDMPSTIHELSTTIEDIVTNLTQNPITMETTNEARDKTVISVTSDVGLPATTKSDITTSSLGNDPTDSTTVDSGITTTVEDTTIVMTTALPDDMDTTTKFATTNAERGI